MRYPPAPSEDPLSDTFELLQQGLQDRDPTTLREAEARYREQVRAQPGDANSWHLLAVIAHSQRHLDDAEAHVRQALALLPDRAEFHNTLGLVHSARGDRSTAIQAFRTAADLPGDYPPAVANLARHLYETRSFSAALPYLAKVARLHPEDAEAQYRYAHALTQVLELRAGLGVLRELTRRHPAMPEAWAEVGRVFAIQGRSDRARKAFQRANELAQANPDLQLAICDLELSCGFQRTAYEDYQHLVRQHPDHASALTQLAQHFPDRLEREQLEKLQHLAANQEGEQTSRRAHYALALAADVRGDPQAARFHAAEANAQQNQRHRRTGVAWNPPAWRNHIGEIITTFSPAMLKRARRQGDRGQKPIIIVGLPYSGAEHLEQIIGSHPQVFRGGALKIITLSLSEVAVGAQTPGDVLEALRELSPEAISHHAQRTSARTAAMTAGLECWSNHLPEIFLQLGWLCTLYPEARVIHATRSCRDAAIAAWFMPSEDSPWATRPASILDYMEQYYRLMRHWSLALPRAPLTVSTDNLLREPEPIVERILTFCGLAATPETRKRGVALGRRHGGALGPIRSPGTHAEVIDDIVAQLEALDVQRRLLTNES